MSLVPDRPHEFEVGDVVIPTELFLRIINNRKGGFIGIIPDKGTVLKVTYLQIKVKWDNLKQPVLLHHTYVEKIK